MSLLLPKRGLIVRKRQKKIRTSRRFREIGTLKIDTRTGSLELPKGLEISVQTGERESNCVYS